MSVKVQEIMPLTPNKNRNYVCATYPAWNYKNCTWVNECMVRRRNCEHDEGWVIRNKGYCKEDSRGCTLIKHTLDWTIP
uniref:Uncharacterized protein n=1 Tax=Glossina brevipalpis TaxID=37001 RepID=A0A1A9WNR6_9MUSC